jgi:Raf kinase inhibitor-like YbhB/YbcL family protein
MESTRSSRPSTLHRIALVVAALALPLTLAGFGGAGIAKAAPAGGPLTISSPAFADGGPIPAQYTCRGLNIAPPLAWSVPFGGALIVDDPDAVGGTYVHWIVTGIAPGPGRTGDGQTPAGGIALPNSDGEPSYTGPCPPPGSGVHHYRFTLYQLPATLQLPPGLVGLEAAQAITQATTAQVQLTGIVGG